MEISTRSVGAIHSVKIKHDDIIIDCGLMNDQEMHDMALQFMHMIVELLPGGREDEGLRQLLREVGMLDLVTEDTP